MVPALSDPTISIICLKNTATTIRIINVDCLTYAGNLENLKDIEEKENYTFIKADICDGEKIDPDL